MSVFRAVVWCFRVRVEVEYGEIKNKSKVVLYSITSVGHGPDPGFLAVSPQVT